MESDAQERVADLLHEAALEPDLWDVALEQLAGCVAGSSVSVLASYDPSGAHLLGSVRYDPDNWRRVQLEHATPATNRYIGMINQATAGTVLWPRSVLSAPEWRDDPIRRKFLRPVGLRDGLIGSLVQDQGSFVALSIFSRHEYERRDLATLAAFMPDLRRAVIVSRRLGQLATRLDAASQALDHVPAAIFLVDAQARVKHLNSAAQQVLAAEDGIGLGRGGTLLLSDRSAAVRLLALLGGAQDATTRGRRRWSRSRAPSPTGGAMTTTRPSGRRPYTLLVTPLRQASFPGIPPDAHATAMIFLDDPEHPRQMDARVIADAHGLTMTEARLVAHLVAGCDLRAASVAMGISINTARTLLQRAFDATETRRQADLIGLVLRGPAGVARPTGAG